jgi:hypothetical protein
MGEFRCYKVCLDGSIAGLKGFGEYSLRFEGKVKT